MISFSSMSGLTSALWRFPSGVRFGVAGRDRDRDRGRCCCGVCCCCCCGNLGEGWELYDDKGPVDGVVDDFSDSSDENADFPLITDDENADLPLITDLPPLKPLSFAEARDMTLVPLAATLRLLLYTLFESRPLEELLLRLDRLRNDLRDLTSSSSSS